MKKERLPVRPESARLLESWPSLPADQRADHPIDRDKPVEATCGIIQIVDGKLTRLQVRLFDFHCDFRFVHFDISIVLASIRAPHVSFFIQRRGMARQRESGGATPSMK